MTLFTFPPILVYLFIGLFLFILIVFIVSGFQKTNTKKVKQLDEQSEKLKALINARTEILTRLENEIENTQIDRTFQLNKPSLEVLDMYEQSQIKIPIEIIEDLTHHRMTDKEQIVNFIENQRLAWKLEHTKKLYRMDVKR